LGVNILDRIANHQSSCVNFSYYLKYQLPNEKSNKIIVAYEKKYHSIINELRPSLMSEFDVLGFYDISEDQSQIIDGYTEADRVLFFYDHFTRQNLQPGFSKEMQAYSQHFSKDPLKVIFINDMYEQFPDIYSVNPQRIKSLNKSLISLAEKSKILTITDNIGTNVTVDLAKANPWTSIDGTTYGEIIPGEIASYSPGINGVLYFTGSFLSMIPIGLKYGVIEDPIKFVFKNSKVESFSSSNIELSNDLNYFFEYSEDHLQIHEIGIGTNEGIKKLFGKNASFEEKHCGIHFGLGGKADDTFHLDMMMTHSIFKFDDQLVYDGAYQL
jgi:hypothetical protein